MNRSIFFKSAVLLLCLSAMGQTCRRGTRDPATLPGVPFDSYSFNSLRIIQDQRESKVACIRVVFAGGLASHDPSLDGADALIGDWILQGGAEDATAAELAVKLEAAGAVLSSEVTADYVAFDLIVHPADFKKAWPLFAHLLMKPALPDALFESLRENRIKQLRKESARTAWQVAALSRASHLPGHHSRSVQGTQQSLAQLRPAAVRQHYKEGMLRKWQMRIIATGFSDSERLVQELIYSLDGVAAGDSLAGMAAMGQPVFVQDLQVQHVPGQVPVIRGLFGAPLLSSAEYPLMLVALRIVQARIQQRVNREFVYSQPPRIDYARGTAGYAVITAETQWPGDWARLIQDEFSRCRREGFSAEEVNQAAALLRTDHAIARQMPPQLCTLLAEAEVAGDWRAALWFDHYLTAPKPAEVSEVFNHYCNAVSWSLAGDTTGLYRKAFLQPFTQ